jgi:DivIVA domain-containing protein
MWELPVRTAGPWAGPREIVLFWFMLIALVAVVAAVALAVLGDGGALKDAPPERIEDRLPPDRPLVREDVDAVRLPVALRGYRMIDVDEVLERLGVELAERDARIADLEARLGVPAGSHLYQAPGLSGPSAPAQGFAGGYGRPGYDQPGYGPAAGQGDGSGYGGAGGYGGGQGDGSGYGGAGGYGGGQGEGGGSAPDPAGHRPPPGPPPPSAHPEPGSGSGSGDLPGDRDE